MLIPIVDEEDNIIEYKERGSLNKEDIYRVSALWIENSKGETLLAQRSFNKKHHPGLWGPAVAGTVEKGESYEENILHEIEEELGIFGVKVFPWIKIKTSSKYNHFTQWFKAIVDKSISQFKISEDEVGSIKWISKEELLKEFQNNPNNYLESLQLFVREQL